MNEIKKHTVVVLGATGLVGSELVKQLIHREDVGEVKCLVRRETSFGSDKVTDLIVDLDNPESYQELVAGDVLFSAFGTTLKKAGSKETQYKIDHTYQLQVAEAAKKNGVNHYILISSVGADPESSMFYNRMKGELDRDVEALGFEKLSILRPSVLDGDRSESRPAEKIGIWVGRYVLPIIPYFRKYRAIKAQKVAAAMIGAWTTQEEPTMIREADELFRLAAAAKD